MTSQQTLSSITNPPSSINDIAWSPDGNYIAMCGGWEGSSASFDMYEYGIVVEPHLGEDHHHLMCLR